jgi:hypothetical protein
MAYMSQLLPACLPACLLARLPACLLPREVCVETGGDGQGRRAVEP